MLRRVPVKPSLQQEDRLPCETYEQAVDRLVQYHVTDTISDEAYDLAVKLVADIFWQTDKRVRRDVFVATRKLFGGVAW